MDTIYSKNRIADQFAYSQIPVLEEVVKPLKKFGISHFSYTKFVGEDKYMLLSPYLPWIRENYGYSLDEKYLVKTWLNHFRNSKKILLWQVLTAYNPYVQGLRVYNLNHGLSFFRMTEEDVYEVFHFATTNENEQILDFYLKNMSLLNVFVDYFLDKMSDILDHKIPGKLFQLEGSQHGKDGELIKPSAIGLRRGGNTKLIIPSLR
jgi:hypothetical protein